MCSVSPSSWTSFHPLQEVRKARVETSIVPRVVCFHPLQEVRKAGSPMRMSGSPTGFHPLQEVRKVCYESCTLFHHFSFPSLIGSQKSKKSAIENSNAPYVSIPYRKLEKPEPDRGHRARNWVSIPYRKLEKQIRRGGSGQWTQGFHPLQEVRKAHLLRFGFHPLQEVRKARSSKRRNTPQSRFHPLQEVRKAVSAMVASSFLLCFHPLQEVRKGPSCARRPIREQRFPSLIGSQKRHLIPFPQDGTTQVSIPYRKLEKICKNSQCPFKRSGFHPLQEVRKSLIGSQKRHRNIRAILAKCSFPSLIGSQKREDHGLFHPNCRQFPSLIGSQKRSPIESAA